MNFLRGQRLIVHKLKEVVNTLQAKVIQAGIRQVSGQSEQRNVKTTNFISIVVAVAFLTVILFRLLTGRVELWFALPLLIDSLIFMSLISLNAYGITTLSRVLLCWAPAAILIVNFRIVYLNNPIPETAHFVGFRIFQIAFACFPFLVFNYTDWKKIVTALSVPLLCMLFFDSILTFLQVGYWQAGLNESSYSYNSFRAFIAISIVGSSFLFLRKIIEDHERANTELVNALIEQNVSIQQHASEEVDELNEQLMANLEELTKRESEQRVANYHLKERLKELTALHRVSQLLNKEHETPDTLLQSIVEVLPAGLQYSEICEAEISLFGKSYTTSRFNPSPYHLRADLHVNNIWVGKIEVVYLEERPLEAEGLFFKEERNVVNIIAEMLQIYLEQKQEEEELIRAQANLHATINNTEIQIWSVDRQFKLLSFNKPFENYMRKTYGTSIQTGETVFSSMQNETNSTIEKWEGYYLRALAGDFVNIEESRFGRDFNYTLNPIIEKGRTSGISVFGHDITERKAHDRALAEANKKIGELKLMALRSIMNPHFIFNALNSIQFYIANNERVNAINYLSTFSKLIRMVLTHSVSDQIRLSEKIEMLKNYIELEKLRFEGKFEYFFEIDQNVNAEEIRIPTLLMQPYVENAIIHGLQNKAGKGKLVIRITECDEHLVFEVEDNGIGREATAKLNAQKQPAHKSVGTKLTEERLKLINDQSGVAVSFTDLWNGSEPAGTRVTIKIKPY
jgi:PAS domain-containing protein